MQALAAAAILATTLCGITSMWYVSFNITSNSNQMGVAYMIGRRLFEYIKQNGYQPGGFVLPANGTTTNYYDLAGNDTTTASTNHVFTAVTVITTSNALETVTVTVTDPVSSKPLYQSSTYLVAFGI